MHGGRVDPREPSGDDKKGKNVSTTNEVLVPVHSGTLVHNILVVRFSKEKWKQKILRCTRI